MNVFEKRNYETPDRLNDVEIQLHEMYRDSQKTKNVDMAEQITPERIAELRAIIAAVKDRPVIAIQADFFHAARNDLPSALDTIEAQRRRIEELEAAFMPYTGSAHEFITKLRAISRGSDMKVFTSMDQMNASLVDAQKVVTHETPLLKLLVDAEIEATRARVLAIKRFLDEPRLAYRLSWDERDALTYTVNMSRDIC